MNYLAPCCDQNLIYPAGIWHPRTMTPYNNQYAESNTPLASIEYGKGCFIPVSG